GEGVATLEVQFGDAAYQRRALGDGRTPRPTAVRGIRAVDRGRKVRVRDGRVALHGLARRRVDYCIRAHGLLPTATASHDSRRAAMHTCVQLMGKAGRGEWTWWQIAAPNSTAGRCLSGRMLSRVERAEL